MALIPQDVIDRLSKEQQQKEQDSYQAARPNLSHSNTTTSQDEQPTIDQQEEEKPKFDAGAKYGGMWEDLDKKQAPEYNTRYEKQQKSLMTAQTIGNALALVGDVAGAAKGAPVKRRQFKSTEPYLQAIENKRQQYEKDTQSFEHEKLIEQYKLLGYIKEEEKDEAAAEQQGIVNARAEENMLYAKKRDEAAVEQQGIVNARADAAEVRAGKSLDLRERGVDLQEKGLDLRETAQKEDIVAQKARTGLEREKFEEGKFQFREELTADNVKQLAAQVARDEKGNLMLYGASSEESVATLDASKVKRAFSLLLEDYGDSAELQKDLAMMKPAFGEGLSKGNIELLVARHWDKSPKVKKFLQLDTDEPDFSGAKVTGAVGDTTTQVQKPAYKLPGIVQD